MEGKKEGEKKDGDVLAARFSFGAPDFGNTRDDSARSALGSELSVRETRETRDAGRELLGLTAVEEVR